MADYVYMANPAKIREFLQKIQSSGVPDKLTQQSLGSLGFKSNNDRSLINVMKKIGFISSSAAPTDRWQQYRNKQIASGILAEGIKEHYAELYKIYPDAHLRDNEALRNFFSTHTKVSEGTLNFIVLTFRTLCESADFSAVLPKSPLPIKQAAVEVGQQANSMITHKDKAGYTININIQLTLPSDAKKETFDAFFESMKKHLID